jgi:hypothetical protein
MRKVRITGAEGDAWRLFVVRMARSSSAEIESSVSMERRRACADSSSSDREEPREEMAARLGHGKKSEGRAFPWAFVDVLMVLTTFMLRH